jgi:hypothetical protein
MHKKIETSPLRWEYQEYLPEMDHEQFMEIYQASKVRNGARLFPHVEDRFGNKIWITELDTGNTI